MAVSNSMPGSCVRHSQTERGTEGGEATDRPTGAMGHADDGRATGDRA